MMNDPALSPSIIITRPGPEFADQNRHFQGIPGIERAPKGRLWAAWYSGGSGEEAGNYVLLATSADEGASWSAPVAVVTPPSTQTRSFDPCLWLDPKGDLWLFWSQSLEKCDGRFGVWAAKASYPDCETPAWSEPRRIGDGIMMNKPTVTHSGEWLLPVSIWPPDSGNVSAEPFYFNMDAATGAYAVVSRDHGKTFEYLGRAASQQDRSFDEHMIVERRDRSLWMLSRTRHGIWENVSTDGGKNWSEGNFSGIPHIDARFFIRRLISGNLLLVRHNSPAIVSDKVTRSHLTAWISKDDGRTWLGGLLLDDREGVSYPDGTQAPDGTIYIIHDFNRTKEKNILLAVFTEQDVEAADWSSPQARKRILVNAATGVM
ncbi:MAG: sialidase family protein [Chthoniobacteraceae bacterium]